MVETSNGKEVNQNTHELNCGYLVIGAGTAGMSFIDTLLTENATCTIILIDRNTQAGGHWTKAYPFVRLHQPSCNYGVNSLRLGKSSDSKGREVMDIHDRATGTEIVQYYGKLVEQFKTTDRVRCFFDAEYKESNGLHTIVDTKGCVHRVKCGKVVTVATNVVVPSMRDPLFPIDNNINYITVNELPKSIQSGNYKNYVILGAGKTGSDAVVELLKKGIVQSNITWIISRDVWYILRDGLFGDANYWKNAYKWMNPIIHGASVKDIFLALEKSDCVGRLHPHGKFPMIFKGPLIDKEELGLLRSVKGVVRLGRVKSIEASDIILEEGKLPFDTEVTLFVDCMVDKNYGYNDFPEDFKFFETGRVNLGPLIALFNPSFTSAIIAYIEATFNNNETKNKLCFPLLGIYGKAVPDALLGGMYAQSKQMAALRSHPPAMKFVLHSRTNADAPMHHGGMWKMLWAVFGPMQLRNTSKKLIDRIEQKTYDGIDHTFGNGREHVIDSEEVQDCLLVKKKVTSDKDRTYPPSVKKSNGVLSCKSIAAVA